MQSYQISGNGPAAEFARNLQAAGYDLGQKEGRNWGTLCYNAARLTWQAHRRGGHIAGGKKKDLKIRCNDPCPCGSGLKYKRCCLRTASAPVDLVPSPSPSQVPFGPELIPNLMDSSAVLEDMHTLVLIMERDEELEKVRFSSEKVEAFLEENPLKKRSKDRSAEVDEMAFRYVKESGEQHVLEKLRDKFLSAAGRAQSAEEIRALSLGELFAAQAHVIKDEDNLLTPLLFRRELAKLLSSYQLMDDLVNKLGEKDAVLKRIEEGDISIGEDYDSVLDSLRPEEREALLRLAEKDHEYLWDKVSSEDFPVKLPVVTIVPFLIPMCRTKDDKAKVGASKFIEIIENGLQELCDEDLKLYEAILDQWLEHHTQSVSKAKRRSRRKADSKWLATVRSLRVALKSGPFELYADALVKSSLTSGSFSTDEKEMEILGAGMKALDDFSCLGEYSDYLESNGYPKLAERTRNYVS